MASCKTAADVRSWLRSIDSNRFRLARRSALVGSPALRSVRRTLSRCGPLLVPWVRGASSTFRLLLGHSKHESTARSLGIEVDDALQITAQTDMQLIVLVAATGGSQKVRPSASTDRAGGRSMRRADRMVAATPAFGIPLGQQLPRELPVGRIDMTQQPLTQIAHGDHHA